MKNLHCHFFLLALCLSLVKPIDANDIPEKAIEELVTEANSIDPKQSSTRLRRAYKNLIRDGQDLIENHPKAQNRFPLLHSILKLQIKLLSIDRSERIRSELFETCEELLLAPDEYAEQRLDADIFLTDKTLTSKEADLEDREKALQKIVTRYYNTSAELKSLKAAIKMTEQWELFDQKKYYAKRVAERFGDDHGAIAFLRSQMGFLGMDAIFSGTFSTGLHEIHFPYDRMGQPFMVIFWSSKDPSHQSFLTEIKEAQQHSPNQYEIFSFNLDPL